MKSLLSLISTFIVIRVLLLAIFSTCSSITLSLRDPQTFFDDFRIATIYYFSCGSLFRAIAENTQHRTPTDLFPQLNPTLAKPRLCAFSRVVQPEMNIKLRTSLLPTSHSLISIFQLPSASTASILRQYMPLSLIPVTLDPSNIPVSFTRRSILLPFESSNQIMKLFFPYASVECCKPWN